MIGKKINQLATELAPVSTDLTIIGDPVTGVSKKITIAQLGAIFSGAVSFYTNLAAFPVTGDINVIYCAKDTQKLYLWSGSAYVEVFPSQALLNTYQLRSEKGVSNGYASLDSGGKVPISQLPSSIMEYKGTWNAATNTPTLANGTGDTGDVFVCNVAGSVNFGAGPITFAVGDYVIYSGSIWQRSSGAVGTVTSVAASITGNSIGITGSPVTTSGTLALAFAGTSAQYVNGAGNLITFPSIISQAQNLVTEVYNKTGATLTKGTVVYINGGQGNLPSITKALATGDSTSAQTYGIVQNDITNNNNGFVVAAGRLSDLDTQAFTEGTQLYLSPTTAGTYQSAKPYAPQHLVYVAIVVRAHPTQGVIEVKIQNGYEMDELHNVSAQSPSNGDILQYVTSTSLWTKTAGTTTNIAEGTNLYYTEARVNANTNVAANTAARHNAVTIGTANGLSLSTQVLSLALASGSTTGALSSTDWTTFNSKQNALTNPITGSGLSGQVTFFNGANSVTGSNNLFYDTTNNRLGIGLVNPQRSLEIFNATADAHLRLSGNAPSVSMGEAVTGSIYQAKFGLVTVNGQFVTAGVAGDFVIISQTGATIIGTSSTEKMRVQSSGNVSINNTNNTYRLDVTGTGRFTGQLRLESTITNGTYTYTLPSATGTLALTSDIPSLSGYIQGSGTTNYLPKFTGASTIGNSNLINDASGNLGLGVTPSAWFASVKSIQIGALGGTVITGNTTEGGTSTFGQNWYFDTSFKYAANGTSTYYAQGSGQHIWYQAPNNTSGAGAALSFTQAMTLNASGNLSVGNTNDSFKLDVSGTGRFTGSVTTAGALFTAATETRGNIRTTFSSDNSYFSIFSNDGALTLDTYGVGGFMNFKIAGTTRLTIASTGAATFSSSVTATQGNFNQSGSAFPLNLKNRNATQTWAQIIDVNAIDDKYFGLYDVTNSAYRLVVTNGGNVGIGTTSPACKLHVEAESASYGQVRIINTATSGEASIHLGRSNQTLEQRWTIGQGVAGIGDSFGFYTVGSPRVVLTSSGNVGIGTTSPSAKLDVTGVARILMPDDPLTGAITAKILSFSGNPFGLVFRGYATGAHSIQSQRENNDAQLYALSLQPLGGNVGIGTTSPAKTLTVVNTGEQLRLAFSTGSTFTDFRNDSAGGLLVNTSGGYIINYIAGTERFRIKTNTINISSLPTSSAGLSSGDLYSSAGVLMIV